MLWALLASAVFFQDPPVVEQWGVFETSFTGSKEGNPFTEVDFSATFSQGSASFLVNGFYDGEGIYRVRFSPPTQGDWRFVTKCNRPELNGKQGQFRVGKPGPSNHGPVGVKNTFHFAYADGTPYFQVGTTCYAWVHQEERLQEQTLTTLKNAPFNKLRMCVFPKWYAYNKSEPSLYPFAGKPPSNWDFSRFNPPFFRHLEKRLTQLRDMGIEADLILFHPYDEGHWGFDRMNPTADDRYLRYTIARLAAFRNAWWSLANEFDFMKEKKDEDWERFLKIVKESDPYGRLRSIHNGTRLFNHNHPLLTHASIQNGSAVSDFGRAVLFRDAFYKPILFDEVKYEGDFEQRWGNLSAEEMVHRFWQAAIAGTYCGHGETYKHPQDLIWWSKGGTLRGKSSPRLGLLKKIMEEGPRDGLEPIDKWQDPRVAGKKGEFYLVYFGKDSPASWAVDLPRSGIEGPLTLKADVIDTWNMTVTPVPGKFTLHGQGKYRLVSKTEDKISLPGKPWMAIRLQVLREK